MDDAPVLLDTHNHHLSCMFCGSDKYVFKIDKRMASHFGYGQKIGPVCQRCLDGYPNDAQTIIVTILVNNESPILPNVRVAEYKLCHDLFVTL